MQGASFSEQLVEMVFVRHHIVFVDALTQPD